MSKYDALPETTDWRKAFRVGDVLPSASDPRDFPALARGETPVTLPASYRLPERPIRNQGGKGSCVAFTFARIMERGFAIAGRTFDGSEDEMYARLRVPYQWLCQDSGSFPRDAADVSVTEGWMTEEQRPYNDRDLCTGPDPNRIALGAGNRGTEYRLARTWEDVKQLIYQFKVGVSFCLSVYDSFFDTGSDGIMPLPSGRPAGGHCMTLEGWDERFAWVANSWSSGWGQRGYLRVPLRYVDGTVPPQDGGVWTGDLWTVIVKAPEPDPPPPPDRGYTEGYDDRRDQDLDFIDGMIRFYREQGTEFATIAGMVCHYAYEMMHDFQPPHAAPALPQPPTMKG